MASNKPIKVSALPPAVKAALEEAVKRLKSQVAVAEELGVSGAVISTLLKDKYPGNVDAMAERIRGKYMGETVKCPVMGNLDKNSCQDYQGQPIAFTNPLRAALGRACKTCIHRKEIA